MGRKREGSVVGRLVVAQGRWWYFDQLLGIRRKSSKVSNGPGFMWNVKL